MKIYYKKINLFKIMKQKSKLISTEHTTRTYYPSYHWLYDSFFEIDGVIYMVTFFYLTKKNLSLSIIKIYYFNYRIQSSKCRLKCIILFVRYLDQLLINYLLLIKLFFLIKPFHFNKIFYINFFAALVIFFFALFNNKFFILFGFKFL